MVNESDMKEGEKTYVPSKTKTFIGYYLPSNTIVVAMIGIFAAVICVLTMLIQIPIPATGGYINIGDAGVMIAALLFGPVIGGIAGGVGSMLADLFTGYVIYAPATLIIKGLEGLVIGIISNPRKNYKKFSYRDIMAVVVGGFIIVFGYFVYESILYGPSVALVEVPGNIFQFIFGAILALIFAFTARKRIIDLLPDAFEKIFIIEIPENI